MIRWGNVIVLKILCEILKKADKSRNFAIFAATFLIGHLFSNRKIR